MVPRQVWALASRPRTNDLASLLDHHLVVREPHKDELRDGPLILRNESAVSFVLSQETCCSTSLELVAPQSDAEQYLTSAQPSPCPPRMRPLAKQIPLLMKFYHLLYVAARDQD